MTFDQYICFLINCGRLRSETGPLKLFSNIWFLLDWVAFAVSIGRNIRHSSMICSQQVLLILKCLKLCWRTNEWSSLCLLLGAQVWYRTERTSPHMDSGDLCSQSSPYSYKRVISSSGAMNGCWKESRVTFMAFTWRRPLGSMSIDTGSKRWRFLFAFIRLVFAWI